MDAQPAQVCRVQHPAPNFEAEVYYPDGTFKKVQLSDFKGKYLVLMWYPLDFTFVCPTEIIKFSDAKPEFDAMDCVVLACSVDSVHSHKEWSKKDRKKGGLDPMALPMLSDLTHKIAADYGCQLVLRRLRGQALAFSSPGLAPDHQRRTTLSQRRIQRAPLCPVKMARRRHLGSQRARLEAVELRLRLPEKTAKTHCDRLGFLPRHSLQHPSAKALCRQ